MDGGEEASWGRWELKIEKYRLTIFTLEDGPVLNSTAFRLPTLLPRLFPISLRAERESTARAEYPHGNEFPRDKGMKSASSGLGPLSIDCVQTAHGRPEPSPLASRRTLELLVEPKTSPKGTFCFCRVGIHSHAVLSRRLGWPRTEQGIENWCRRPLCRVAEAQVHQPPGHGTPAGRAHDHWDC